MNIVFTLEYMGYVNGVDFEHTNANGLVWLSKIKSKPDDAEIQNAWDYFKANEDTYQIDAERESALNRVDGIASYKRSQYISGGIGQELIYNEKAKQAEDFKNSGYVNPENYPFIVLESEALDYTPQEVADTILANRAAWIQLGATIEASRLSAKQAIRAATTISEMQSIIDNLKNYYDSF